MASRVHEEIVSLCKQNGIEYVDPLAMLQKFIENNEQIYPWTGDSHYLPTGYLLLASEVNKSLKRLGW